MNSSPKPSRNRSKSNELRLGDVEIDHVGVDVHKANYHVAVVCDHRDLVTTWVHPASPEALFERLTPIAAQAQLSSVHSFPIFSAMRSSACTACSRRSRSS